MALSSLSVEATMIGQSNNWRTVTPDSASAALNSNGKSERILRWKSREPLPEQNDQQGSGNSASPGADRSSSKASTSQVDHQQGEARPKPKSPVSKGRPQGPPYARRLQESPSRRGESVRRRAPIDFDALQFSNDSTSAHRFESGSTCVTSFDELLTQQRISSSSSTTSGSGQSPAAPSEAAAAANGEDPNSSRMSSSTNSGVSYGPGEGSNYSKDLTRVSRSIKPQERSHDQILKARKLLEFRSNLKPPPGDLETTRMQQPRDCEITLDTSRSSCSYEYIDLTDMAREMAAVCAAKSSAAAQNSRNCNNRMNHGSSYINSNSVPSPNFKGHGFGNLYFSPKSEKLKNQILQSDAAGESSSAAISRSSPRVLEFSEVLPMFEALQAHHASATSELRVDNGEESPQVRAQNAFLERLHGAIPAAEGPRAEAAIALNLQVPAVRQSRNGGDGFRPREPLSQSARFLGPQQTGPDIASPKSQAAGLRTTSSFPHQSLRKVVESTARTSGLSVSCRLLSLDHDVFESYRMSNPVSFGCRPSPSNSSLRPKSATSSEEKRSSSSRDVLQYKDLFDDQRIPKSEHETVVSSQSTALVESKAKLQTPRLASPARSFKKWVVSQFHLGGSKKSKDGRDKPSLPSSDQRLHLPANDSQAVDSFDSVQPRKSNAAGFEFPAHPLPEPPGDSSAENGNLVVRRLRQISDSTSEQSTAAASYGNSKDSGLRIRRLEKTSSRRIETNKLQQNSIRSPTSPSGPPKLNLFAADVSSSSPKLLQQSSPEIISAPPEYSDGKPKRSMEFLQFAEIAELNDFLRAKRACLTSCRKNGSGHLKFVATMHPTDMGSMIAAICYSYLLEKRRNGSGSWSVVPLVSFPRWKMTEHLDAAWLFNVCGLDAKALVFINEVDLGALPTAGVTTRTVVVGEEVLTKTDEVGSCCTLLAESFSRDEDELWTRSGSFLKTLLLAGLLMDTDNLSKASSSRDHQMLLSLATGAGPLGRLGLFQRMRIVQRDPEVLKMAEKYYGAAAEQATASHRTLPPPPPLRAMKTNGAMVKTSSSSPKGSPLFSSEAEDNSRSSGSSTSRSSSSRSRFNRPAATMIPPSPPVEKWQLRSSGSLSQQIARCTISNAEILEAS